MVEMVGSGSALFDVDNDGDLDVFLVQGGPLGPGAKPDPVRGPRHRLFRNDLAAGPSGPPLPRFIDITDQAGLNFADYGMGAIAGDYDGDGWIDLFVTCFGRNRLLHNAGDGTGRLDDVTGSAGVGGNGGWSTSAAWVDFDRDGKLDLIVCRYLEWSFAVHKRCSGDGRDDYCGPQSFVPSRSQLYRNRGDGTFEDVSLKSHLAGRAGAALGVVCADVDGDGWPDAFVANDGMANHLWINQKDGTFAEEALSRGCAVNCDGATEANMGLIAADFRNHGWNDLFITHLKNERSTFYRNLGDGQFVDETASLGLDAVSRPFTGFGTGAIDYDNDGWLDIFAANGEVKTIDEQVKAGIALPCRQRCLLLRSLGGSSLRFEPQTQGEFLEVEEVGRGAAFGDLDNDGDLDIVVTNCNGPVRLLINQVGQSRHWMGLRLVDGPPGRRRDVLGAEVRLERPDGPPLSRRCATDGSYLSSSDPRVLFGLGNGTTVSRVTVRWPDGLVEEWTGLSLDRYQELCRGAGTKVLK